MKKPIMLLAALFAVTMSVFAADSHPFSEDERQALQGAVDKVQAALKKADALPAAEAIAILPIKGDNGSALSLLKTAVTDAGKTCVEGKEDPMWDEILKEIAWDERKLDILDPVTVDKFGALKSAQILLYGELIKTKTDESVLVELELHATRIKTKQHIWGGVFDNRYFKSKDVKGISELPGSLRAILREQMATRIMKSIAAQPKLAKIKNLAIVPLAGDEDKYVTYIVRDAIARTKIISRDYDTETRAETLGILRDKPQSSDAYLFGAVRDLGVFLVSEKEASLVGEDVSATSVERAVAYIAKAEVQLCIEDPITRDQLWSDTIYVPVPYKKPTVKELPVPFDELTVQALEKAVEKAEISFRNSEALPNGVQIAVLPICYDRPDFNGTASNAARSRIKMALTKAGKNCVESNDDPIYKRLVEEIDWDGESAQILDGSTIDRFGSLQAGRILVYGAVHTNKLDNGMYVELELHAAEVATKKHLWGDVFTQRYYLPNHTGPKYQDIKTMPMAARQDIHDQVVAQLADSIAARKGAVDLKSVVLVPPVGDDEGYGWTILKDALFKAGINWCEYDVRTRGEALAAIRDRPQEAEGLAWGNLIGYCVEEEKKDALSDLISVKTNVYFEMQINIEKASTRNAVWSETLRAKTQLATSDFIKYDVPEITVRKLIKWAGWGLVGIVALIILGMVIKAATRVR